MAERYNHNGGPMDRRLTDREFRSLVTLIVFSRLPGNQKLLSIGAVSAADNNGEAALGAEDMKRICSVTKRDTVFAAKKAIADNGLGIVSTVPDPGKANRYRIMPPDVVTSIITAYNARKEHEDPVPKSGTSPVPKMGTSTRPAKGTTGVHQNGTSPIPQIGTSPEKGDGSRALAPACLETPSGLVITQEVEEVSEEKEEGGKDRQSAAATALRVFETYNDLAQKVGLPLARGLTPERKKAIAARLRDHGGYEAWESVLSNIERSNFLQGKNDKHWRPTGLDWFLKAANFTKVIEGAYGNGAHASDDQGNGERWARMVAESEAYHE